MNEVDSIEFQFVLHTSPDRSRFALSIKQTEPECVFIESPDIGQVQGPSQYKLDTDFRDFSYDQ